MEQAINKQLSGTEIAKAILYDLEKAFMHDDRLAGHVAYDGFSYIAAITIRTPSGAKAEFNRTVGGGEGDVDPLKSDAEVVTAQRDIQPPNIVRAETEQPLPVLVQGDNGAEEKWVQYNKNLSPAPFPNKKNKVRG